MNARLLRVVAVTTALLSTQAFGQELIENVVVRNRLYSPKGNFEAGVNVGVTLLSRLVDHYNLNAHFGYNLGDHTAVELRGGYTLGPGFRTVNRHTGLARDIQDHFLTDSSKEIDDLADMWEMTWNASVGFRWAPIYGKISLMSELAVHFQAYAWLGAGVGGFQRESIVICVQGSTGKCDAYLSDQKVGPMGVGALGARFFLTPQHSFSIELRDYAFPDQYRENVNRAQALTGNVGDTYAQSPGVTQLVQLDFGYSFLF